MANVTIFSDSWFDMLEQANTKIGDLNLSPAMKNVELNLLILDKENTEAKEISMRFVEGLLHKGQLDNAVTNVSLSLETTKVLLQKMTMFDATQAFINGDIQVAGDMSQLMTLQMAKISDEQKLLYKTILQNTELEILED